LSMPAKAVALILVNRTGNPVNLLMRKLLFD
jgi:hypothetical protein